ncbi:MAG: ABC transporter permease, partial [bacterium]|nr:ABC transporter permease [bacterium]
PVAVMPDWMQLAAKLLPITYALEAMRRALFEGQSLRDLWLPLTVLAAMAVVLLPASLWAFSQAVEKGRRDGSLVQY